MYVCTDVHTVHISWRRVSMQEKMLCNVQKPGTTNDFCQVKLVDPGRVIKC